MISDKGRLTNLKNNKVIFYVQLLCQWYILVSRGKPLLVKSGNKTIKGGIAANYYLGITDLITSEPS